MSRSRSTPASTPIPRSRYTRSSVAMLPVAFGANGQPPAPPTELVGGRERVVHLVDAGRDRPLVAFLVEDQARVHGAGLAVERPHHLFGAGHLRHKLGVDEARRLHALEPGRREAVAQFGPQPGLKSLGLVLQAVPRPDVADGERHIDKVEGSRSVIGLACAASPSLFTPSRSSMVASNE